MKDIKFLAIIVGTIVDIFSSNAMGARFGFQLAFFEALAHVPPKDIGATIEHQMHTSAPLLFVAAFVGTIGTFLGAFVTARMAQVAIRKNTALMGVLSVLTSIPFWSPYPLWYNLLGALTTLVAAIGGGLLAESAFEPPQK